MADLVSLAGQHKDLPEQAQKAAGKAIAGDMDKEHKDFLALITGMVKRGEIDVSVPSTFLNEEPYRACSEADRAKVDQAMVNIADLLRHIADFFFSKQTPNESPHLETMIEQLWQMKSRVEEKYGDVFKF